VSVAGLLRRDRGDLRPALPVDAAVAREWGRLASAVAERGGRPRRRAIGLAIAATVNVHGVPLLTADTADLAIIDDLVTVEALG
jgi:predicted nucleic acid-binding protein